jgi:hypothetical protein
MLTKLAAAIEPLVPHCRAAGDGPLHRKLGFYEGLG